jgi:hypothetical protein
MREGKNWKRTEEQILLKKKHQQAVQGGRDSIQGIHTHSLLSHGVWLNTA